MAGLIFNILALGFTVLCMFLLPPFIGFPLFGLAVYLAIR